MLVRSLIARPEEDTESEKQLKICVSPLVYMDGERMNYFIIIDVVGGAVHIEKLIERNY
jgi:hypothetical protein